MFQTPPHYFIFIGFWFPFVSLDSLKTSKNHEIITSILPQPGKDWNQTGKVPIYVRIALNRKKAEMRLNIEVSPEELKKWDERTMRFIDRDMSANALLNTIDKKFEDFRHHHSTSFSEYNVKAIRNLILGLDLKPTPLILTYVEKYYSNEEGQAPAYFYGEVSTNKMLRRILKLN